MTKQEATQRFNAMPVEHRVTVIGHTLDSEIRWLEWEKRTIISAHQKTLEVLNNKIKVLERSLAELKDTP